MGRAAKLQQHLSLKRAADLVAETPLAPEPSEQFDCTVDMLIASAPGRDAQAKGRLATPDGRTEPQLARLLGSCEDRRRRLVALIAHHDLIQHHTVEDAESFLPKAVGQSPCLAAVPIDKLFDAVST